MQPTITYLKEKNLIGCSSKMNLLENKTQELWQGFMPQLHKIKNKISTDLFSIQIYNANYNFDQFDPVNGFTKWAATEVSVFNDVPSNMNALIFKESLYAVFLHKGSNLITVLFNIFFRNGFHPPRNIF